jgi:lipopolysaccharide transport system permease protein
LRDVKVRYKQTILGVMWVALQPLMMTLIFTVFLSILVRVPSDGAPYPLFVYAGLLPWTFFSTAVLASSSSVTSNAHLISKIYFPRMLIPAAAVAGRLLDFAIGFVILGGMLAFYRISPTWNILVLPVFMALTTLLALGSGLLLSALNVKYRDIAILLPVVIQLWLYVSPVLYPSRLVFERLGAWGWVYSLNPLVGILDGFRAALFGGPIKGLPIAFSIIFTFALLIFSAYAFCRVERGFADIV